MAMPVLTPAQRAEARRKAAAVRKERSELMAALKTGSLPLAALLERDDAVVGRIRLRRLVESLPGIGSVRAGRLLANLDICETRRIQGLGPNQRARLLALAPARAGRRSGSVSLSGVGSR
ncbi:integration host factor, actinobacterial type [Streptomyces sp. NPDC002039]|uniref:integration host factor, actinobacterial type n=1 Tax=unclassified Streptomyces TaxID=2593676 RepID=UPI003316AD86